MDRGHFREAITQAFEVNPIVAILGPRQCGKTTIAGQYLHQVPDFAEHGYFDLEDSEDLNRLSDPQLALSDLTGLIVIDEVQRLPELFPTLRVLADKPERKQRFLILGSASRELIRQSSESLAGRISYLELTPFTCSETKDFDKTWLRGGFPKSYLAKDAGISLEWRKAYIRTYLEQDIPNLGIQISSGELRRFWMMLTHLHGNIFNASELGRAMGLSHKTIVRYLDILNGTFMMRRLTPWFENINKRQVKAPKIYFRDSGIYHAMLDIDSHSALQTHIKLGASWEGFALEEVIRHQEADPEECFFWATHGGAELDLLLVKGMEKIGFEFKYATAPKRTKSMQIALETLGLTQLNVISPGDHQYPLAEKITAWGLEKLIALPQGSQKQ